MKEKKCTKCGEIKPVSEFNKAIQAKDKLRSNCRECARIFRNKPEEKAKAKAYRDMHKEKQKEYFIAYYLDNRDRLINNRDKTQVKETQRKWASRNKDYINRKRKERKLIYPEKYRAKEQVRQAVKNGDIIKPKSCQKCGIKGYVEAHHPDYSRPLFVMWLCKKDHGLEHRKINDKKKGITI